MTPTTTTRTATAPTAPLDLAAVDRELNRAEQLWRAVDERTAALAVLRLALATRDTHPGAATITLGWTDQPGTPYLVVETVRDRHGVEITDAADDDGNAASHNLAEGNRHVWQPLLVQDRACDAYRLDIDTITATPPPAPLTSAPGADPAADPQRQPRVEIVSYRDPDHETELRVFLDGTETDAFEWCEADPGAGRTLADWRDSGHHHVRQASPAAARVIHEYGRGGEASEHVTRD